MNNLIIILPVVVSIFSIVFSALALYLSWDGKRKKLFAEIYYARTENNPLIKSDSLLIVIDNVGQISVRVIGIIADNDMLLPIFDKKSKDNQFGKTICPNGSITETIPVRENLEKIKNASEIYIAGPGNCKYKFNNFKDLQPFIEKMKNRKTN